MASREQAHDEDLEKILSKAFDDIRRRVNSLLAKREKKAFNEGKMSLKKKLNDSKPSKKKYSDSDSESD